jgi:hypothetical protein
VEREVRVSPGPGSGTTVGRTGFAPVALPRHPGP